MIYYSHINEDNRVERTLLQEGHFNTVVAICGSGERVLSLMDKNCKCIHVVDNNPEAIFLLQLKITALSHLSLDEYLGFVGHIKMERKERLRHFSTIEPQLPKEASFFWKQKSLLIQKGVLHIGHFERFLGRVRPLSNFWLGKNFQNIFNSDGCIDHVTSMRWKLLKKMFSYKMIYRLAGNRDTAFVGSKAEMVRIPLALDTTLRSRNMSASFIAHLIFKGNLLQMKEDDLPPSLQRNVLSAIKDSLMNEEIRIEYYVEDLLSFIKTKAALLPNPTFYSLSDILSFTDHVYLEAICKELAKQESYIVARSFLRNRLSTEQLLAFQTYGEVNRHDDQETTGMYQVFSVHTCKN